MSLRDTMRKAAGLFVEASSEDEAPVGQVDISGDLPDLDLPAEARLSGGALNDGPQAKSIDQIVREADGPNLDEIAVTEASTGIVNAEGKLNFPSIYKAAKLPDSTFSGEQMLEMMASLPSELPLETKRATVKAMLGTLGKNVGATPESIVADASRKLAALHSFVTFMERKTSDSVASAEKEITSLEAQIEAHKTAIQKSKSELAAVTHGCEAESDRLDDVLEFFSLDVGASKYAAEPSAQPPAQN